MNAGTLSKHVLRPIFESDDDQKLVKQKSMVEVI